MKLNWNAFGKLPSVLERYKYPILILLVGVVFMLWPSGSGEDKPELPAVTAVTEAPVRDEGERYCAETERELESLLSQIHGAGRVRVMLTLKTGPAASYQTDCAQSQSREGEHSTFTSEEKTVMLDRGSAYNEAAVVSTAYPVFQGALIVAEGGADPNVRYQLSAAVAALLGLGVDQITVVKMK